MSNSTLTEIETIGNDVLPVAGAALAVAVPETAAFVPMVEAGVAAGEAVAPDVVSQVEALTAAHAATADRVTAATSLLADLVAFLSHLFPGHSVPGAK